MINIAQLFWAVVALWFSMGIGRAQANETWKSVQPEFSKILNAATARIEKMDGKDADRARHALTLALATSGNYTAACKLAVRLTNTGYEIPVWCTIGRTQGAIAGDRAGTNDAFRKAVAVARRMKAGSSNQRDAFAEIAEAQARSGDIPGAFAFVQSLDQHTRPDALLRLAQFAARRGSEEPALALLRTTTNETDRSQAQSLYALAVAVRNGDTPTARDSLAKVTKPLHKIPVLLALFDHPVGKQRGDARLLDEALAAVAQNQPPPGAFGFTDVQNDAARGAVALRQLQTGINQAEANRQAAATIRTIKSPDNAQKYIEQVCERLAVSDLTLALSLAEKYDGEQRIAVLCAIARGLGRLVFQQNERKVVLLKTVEKIVNQALEIANKMEENDRRWAGVPVVRAVAEAGEFAAAYQVANRIDSANQRAYACAGIARSAIENRREAQAREALKNLEAAALTEKQPEVAAQIIGQSALSITQPLSGDESPDIASVLAGLE